MEQQRFFLVLALVFLSYLAWDAWQRDFGPKPVVTETATASQPAASSAAASNGDVPFGADVRDEVPAASTSVEPGMVAEQTLLKHQQRISIDTDVYHVEIDTHGAGIRVVELKQYPTTLDPKQAKPFRLMNDSLPNLFIAQSGFTTKKARGDNILTAAPNHNTVFSTKAEHYELKAGEDSLQVSFDWKSPEGVLFSKVYEFNRGSYVINVHNKISNPTAEEWRGNLYQQLQRTELTGVDKPKFIYTYTGGVIYSPEDKYKKITFSDMADKALHKDITAGWAAMIQHYFVGAWVPDKAEKYSYYTATQSNGRYVIGMKSANEYVVPAKGESVFSNKLFVGPKLQDKLETIAPGLELTVDYGVLTFIAKPLFWLLKHIHALVGNWGWSIILLTILIKLAFYKLSEASYKSMANMRKVQPRLMAMKERYAGDRQKMNQAMMELYKKEKINPLGGCLPILIQIPVFIALYWVLLETVELRQADWILWIKDLSTADPYFILPLLMGVTMLIQHKLNPAPMDPMQAKIMMILPIVFTVFFAFFPAGLVLYWVVNNTLSIAQQWYITKVVIKA